MNELLIYRSSAGSGKTYVLVLQYLRLVLQQPSLYRRILAVTFTHKATAEMKMRIVRALHDMATGKPTALARDLQAEMPDIDLQAAAQTVLANILHNYGRFNVQTLESFFHQLVRSFSRELQIGPNVRPETDSDAAIPVAVDNLLDGIADDTPVARQLAAWLVDFAFWQMDAAKSWRIHLALQKLAKLLFDEKTDRLFPNGLHVGGWSLPAAAALIQTLTQTKRQFESTLVQMAQQGIALLQQHNLTRADCNSKGGAAYLFNLAAGEWDAPSVTFRALAGNPAQWYTKATNRKADFQQALDAGLATIPQQVIDYYDANIAAYNAAAAVLRYVHTVPLLQYLDQHLVQYRDDNHVLFISDVGRLLARIIDHNDAPFIYEKIGNRYRHFLLDEFQDTSARQWDNIVPLVSNALASGYSALVVGDVKQSIYRWRNSDLRLLQNLEADRHLAPFRALFKPHALAHNYRSAEAVVGFNNYFFQSATQLLVAALPPPVGRAIAQAYAPGTVRQTPKAEGKGTGYVHIKLLAKAKRGEEEATDPNLLALQARIDELLDEGYRHADIAILVRANKHGAQIADYLMRQPGQQYPIASAEALLIANAPVVQALISTLQWLAQPAHTIAWAHVQHVLDGRSKTGTLQTESVPKSMERLRQSRERLLRLPLYECVEEATELLGLGAPPDAYLQRLLDVVLDCGRDGYDIDQFLAWWEEEGAGLSIQPAEDGDAIRILTIHKAKGLEFPVVIIPFADWKFSPSHVNSPTFWAHATAEPFAAYSPLLLAPQQELDERSPFYDSYAEELGATYVDNLNLLYVAFTRAEERLYVLAPQVKSTTAHYTAASLIQAVLEAGLPAKATYDAAQGFFTMGVETPPTANASRMAAAATVALPSVAPGGRWRNRLVIRPRIDPALGGAPNEPTPLRWGEWVHQALAAIHTQKTFAADLARALQQMQFDGLLTAALAAKLQAQLEGLVRNPAIAPFFAEGWHVLLEQPVLAGPGQTQRPDRVLVRNLYANAGSMDMGEAIIVDFKTGKPAPVHQAQVAAYARSLRAMRYDPVRACVVYIEDGQVEEVQLNVP